MRHSPEMNINEAGKSISLQTSQLQKLDTIHSDVQLFHNGSTKLAKSLADFKGAYKDDQKDGSLEQSSAFMQEIMSCYKTSKLKKAADRLKFFNTKILKKLDKKFRWSLNNVGGANGCHCRQSKPQHQVLI